MTLMDALLKNQHKLKSFARRVSKGRLCSEDMLQSLVLKILESKTEVDPKYMETFLFQAMKNNCINTLKHSRYTKTVSIGTVDERLQLIPDDAPQPDERIASMQSVINFNACLKKMSKSKKKLVRIIETRVENEDLTYPEIAKLLKMNPETVKANVMVNRKNGTLEELRNTLND